MSSKLEEADKKFCASCGKAEGDDIQLRTCTACKSVRYCGVTCQRNHRPKHKKSCKKRAAELRDEILFKQPESTHLGDCPICCLPLLMGHEKSSLYTCCSKHICKGCTHANQLRQHRENMQLTCPFCRHIVPNTPEATNLIMNRVAANDPVAMTQMGFVHFEKGDYDGAFKNFTNAAELGNVDAHYNLSIMYMKGQGVEKDEKKEIYHLEEAAIAGHPMARHYLGCHEGRNGRIDRAVKHWIIAANLGWDGSIQRLEGCYKDGHVSKEDFAAALRAHHAAIAATKSPQREAAEKNDFG